MLRPDPDRGDDGRNAGASYLMGWGWNFIGPTISTWDLGPI